jgi:hypothetical protein
MFVLRSGIRLPVLLYFLWIMIALTQNVYGEEYRYGFGISPSFISGDYGTTDNVDVFYLPLVFKLYPSDRVRGSIVVPWVSQSSTQVISAGGGFHHIEGMNNIDNRRTVSGSGMMMGGSTGAMGDASAAKDRESGLGDVVLRGEMDLLLETMDNFALVLEGSVKLPTASESKGLGTGEVDAGIAVELGRYAGSTYYYGRVGYTAVGEPSGADFDNPFLYEGGLGFNASPEVYLSFSLEGRTSIDDDVDNPLEAVVSGDYRLRRDLSLYGYLLAGLSDGSPDFGLGIGFLQKF